VIVAKHKKQFLSLCRTQISLEMTAPTSEGVGGMGFQDRGRALGERGEPALSLQSTNLQKFDLDQEER
jgi:hypothetical protein